MAVTPSWVVRPHKPVPVLTDGVVECRTCGYRTVGTGPTLRHLGEDRQYRAPQGRNAAERAVVIDARNAARRATAVMSPLDDHDTLVEAVIAALAAEGMLRKAPRKPALTG